jgi:hypothetical protein
MERTFPLNAAFSDERLTVWAVVVVTRLGLMLLLDDAQRIG